MVQYETESRASPVMGNTISVIIALVVCTPILLAFAVLIPFLCFKNLEKQSIVERLRTE
ncbi:MAG: hypothetical protein KH452_09270 [Clostridiales bacterium]|nr:hypothetical protein [Clostridiales bacterium]